MQNDSFVMLSVTNMSFMLSVIMLNVVDPPFRATGRGVLTITSNEVTKRSTH
jgi:hypothetical protein